MNTKLFKPLGAFVVLLAAGLWLMHGQNVFGGSAKAAKPATHFACVKTDKEWRRILSPEAYNILREQGTEPAFSGKYNHFYEKGLYKCAACGNPLFSSDTKFDSGTGWPSFWQPLSKGSVLEVADHSGFMDRTEVVCARCGGHLGHVFNDGPKPTGLRYCLDSPALKFVKK